jgi:gentisate 1,2-dioxygenase
LEFISDDPHAAERFHKPDKKSGARAGTAVRTVSFSERQKDTPMIALHYRPGRKALRRETMYRRPRAFDDPGAEQFDDWMAACPGADTPHPAASP